VGERSPVPPPIIEQPDECAAAASVVDSVKAWASAAVDRLDHEGLELVNASLSDSGSDL
jgi:hypothetical protein